MVGLGTTDCRWDWRIASVFCVQLFGDCYAWLCRVGSEVVLEKRLWEIKLSTDDDCFLGGMCDAKTNAKTETW